MLILICRIRFVSAFARSEVVCILKECHTRTLLEEDKDLAADTRTQGFTMNVYISRFTLCFSDFRAILTR